MLSKQLVELYKERDQEHATHRRSLRDDIQKLEEDDTQRKLQSDSIKEQLIQKAGEEIEKITDEKESQ